MRVPQRRQNRAGGRDIEPPSLGGRGCPAQARGARDSRAATGPRGSSRALLVVVVVAVVVVFAVLLVQLLAQTPHFVPELLHLFIAAAAVLISIHARAVAVPDHHPAVARPERHR